MQNLKIALDKEMVLSPYSIKNVIVGKDFLKIGGPCSVESSIQILRIAKAVKAGGGNILRGGYLNPVHRLTHFKD